MISFTHEELIIDQTSVGNVGLTRLLSRDGQQRMESISIRLERDKLITIQNADWAARSFQFVLIFMCCGWRT